MTDSPLRLKISPVTPGAAAVACSFQYWNVDFAL